MDKTSAFALGHLSDDALLAGLSRVTRAHQSLTAELVAHLAEVDARKLYLSQATPSLFAYCVGRLGFSEDEACRRITAARLARKWPGILGEIQTGRLSLTVLGLLKPVLSDENAMVLVAEVSGKSVREAERILAARFPKPDVTDSIRKLPDAKRGMPVGLETTIPVTPAPAPQTTTSVAGLTNDLAPLFSTQAGSERTVAMSTPAAPASLDSRVGGGEATRSVDRGRMQPLSAERVQVKFTASRVVQEKLELARDLMSHQNPRGDLATIIEAALDLLIAERLKKKLGQTKRKRTRNAKVAKESRVTSATRREVVARDGLGCTYVDSEGRRCGARAFLELDHWTPKGKGGKSNAENVRLLCAAHNQSEAERVYGKAHMERSRRKRDLTVGDSRACPRFTIGFGHPRRNGSRSSAGRTNVLSRSELRGDGWRRTLGVPRTRRGRIVQCTAISGIRRGACTGSRSRIAH